MIHKVNDGYFMLSCDNEGCRKCSEVFSFNYLESNENYPISTHGGWITRVTPEGKAQYLCPKCQVDLLEKEARASMKEEKRIDYDEFGNINETIEFDRTYEKNIFNVRFGSINIPTIYSINLFRYHEKALIVIVAVIAIAALAGIIVQFFLKHPAFLILLNCFFRNVF